MRQEEWAAEEEEGHGSSPFTTRWSSAPPLSATLLHRLSVLFFILSHTLSHTQLTHTSLSLKRTRTSSVIDTDNLVSKLILLRIRNPFYLISTPFPTRQKPIPSHCTWTTPDSSLPFLGPIVDARMHCPLLRATKSISAVVFQVSIRRSQLSNRQRGRSLGLKCV
jgi:hypothetical protein